MRFPEGLELKSYGQQLLDGRQAKGWSQKQLSKKLFLPVHFIRALEAGEHGMLPEIPYVMSIYRKVAVAVGVDPRAHDPGLQGLSGARRAVTNPSTTTPSRRKAGSGAGGLLF